MGNIKISSGKFRGVTAVRQSEDIRIVKVQMGRMTVRTLCGVYKISSGEALLLPAKLKYVMDAARACFYSELSFPVQTVSFGDAPEKVTADRIGAAAFSDEAVIFRDSVPWQEQVLNEYGDILKLWDEDEPFFDYRIGMKLTAIWLLVMQNAGEAIEESSRAQQKKRRVTQKRMEDFVAFVEEHYKEEITLEQLAKSAGVSKSEALRCFKKTMDTTPYKFLMDYRIAKAADLLESTDRQIHEVAVLTGFDQSSYFVKCFRERMGCTPLKYRNIKK